MKNQSSRSYRATFFSKNQLFRGIVTLLVLFLIVVMIDSDQLRNRLFLYYGLIVLLYIATYGAALLRGKKEFELVIIAEEGITIVLPTQEEIHIPWNQDISVGFYELASVSASPIVGTKYELILSSEPLPPSYQFKQIEHFSVENYNRGNSWQVSLNRGTKKWCQEQAEWILNLKRRCCEDAIGDGSR